MKLNDMTIADIEQAAAQNAEAYDTMFQKSAKAAFNEGACWAYKHLVEKGHDVAWCGQSDPDDSVITDAILRANGFQKMAGDDFYMLTEEVSGIPVIFEYKMSTGALFFCDALIPYPVALLSQIKAVFKVMGVQRELRS